MEEKESHTDDSNRYTPLAFSFLSTTTQTYSVFLIPSGHFFPHAEAPVTARQATVTTDTG